MAMDFFERQDNARRQTVRLLVMFVLAVCTIILAIYLVAVIVAGGAMVEHGSAAARHGSGGIWNPVLFLWIAFGTTLVVSLGSLYKIAELSAGGEAVALMMGGRAVNPQTIDPAERRLLNVVEEMSLASGIPVPPVFVLDGESSINAFAAGHQPGDAVVAVSRGCLEYLNRDELQGVVGHEFSHILNGDMRLNLRLIGIVHGILVLAIVGYYVMRLTGSSSSSNDSKKGDSTAAIFLFGMALTILGYLGVLLGNLIKSAISRQREFLADASSVQFTRNPGGLAGALKKIGGLSEGSRIRDGHAAEISHMFFGDAFAGSFFNLFATHPPLVERVRQLEPEFDGRFPEVQPLVEADEEAHDAAARDRRAAAPSLAVAALDGGAPASRAMVDRIGRPRAQNLQHANRLVMAMPEPLTNAAREPFAARAVVFSLLLSRDDAATRTRQLELLQSQIEPPLYQQTMQLADAAQNLRSEARLPLVDMTIPALKRISPAQYAQFRQVVETLVTADGKIEVFEYCIRVVLFVYLDVHFGLRRPPAVRYKSIAAVARPVAVVLSSVARAGQNRPEEIERAFGAGTSVLAAPLSLLPREQCTFESFDAALGELSQTGPEVKRSVISAVMACVMADGKTTLDESDLVRAIAAALACPVPLGYAA